MTKIGQSTGSANPYNQAAANETAAPGGATFRSTLTRTASASKADTALQDHSGHQRVTERERRDRRDPDVFETAETMEFEEALAELGRGPALLETAGALSVDGLPGVAVIEVNGSAGEAGGEPVANGGSVFLTRAQFTAWKDGSAGPEFEQKLGAALLKALQTHSRL